MEADNILKFPKRRRVHPSSVRRSRVPGWIWRAKARLGESLHKLGFPGRIRSLQLEDALTGQDIVIDASPSFTRVSVNGRDYYYHHLMWRSIGTTAKVHDLTKSRMRSS
jgi:hypothetical protein